MPAFWIVLLGRLDVLAWDVLQLLPILLNDAPEARISLNRKHGDFSAWLELGVVLVHARGVMTFEILPKNILGN